MPDDKDKIEDFVVLWKNKSEENSQSSIGADIMNQLELLKRENNDFRKKIADNIELISKSEEVIRNLSTDRERMRIENDESIIELRTRVNDIERENIELRNRVKSTLELLMEKDDEIKKLSNGINSENSFINEDIKMELIEKNEKIELLNKQISDLKTKNENQQTQLLEKIKSVPTFILPLEQEEDKVLKPLPPQSSNQPLEMLCQDLQTDLNKYKKIIEQLNQEKNHLKKALEAEGITFNVEELNTLKTENEVLRNDLKKLQNSFSNKSGSKDNTNEKVIKDLQEKLLEKEDLIAELKLTQAPQTSSPKEPMTDLVEELQKNINKLKLTIQEKEQRISELLKLLNH